ncbi:PAAR-like domain-containing protein [Mesorhizobium sp. NZP2077]|uniref:PAAR-like domain-containing protein n=1 Tax=Mesorhizobium sp. NZP2077 TaxID=2483404 RepID=UPI0015522480|nr:PAAR-like domain-containing protein [Mesorhizobium sp. NZP2077]QKC86590.1 DUF4150 domain-containing protein [Mesorhizobium sp. NZP2077]QKD18819.1 DUF4150 domain-containing protein [Mesorhizobium sp. NZP2077]
MGLSVYAEKMGFFHKGSNGQGIAPGDVCLSPPSPPAGPVPVPYVNMLSSSDLTKGTKSVKIDGEPTAIENASEISTSTGNEPATQGLGAGVITHQIKGKGVFKLWSFTVKAEGKGVDRHGDTMDQNTASDPPPNCVNPAAFNKFLATLTTDQKTTKCAVKYDRVAHRPKRTDDQSAKVNGKACWQCKKTRRGRYSKLVPTPPNDEMKQEMVHDHQPPLCVAWEMGGCNMEKSPDAFLAHFSTPESVKPHCGRCSTSQGSPAAKYAKNFIDDMPVAIG